MSRSDSLNLNKGPNNNYYLVRESLLGRTENFSAPLPS